MKEFEKWWKSFCEQHPGQAWLAYHEETIKALAWTAWKVGREKMYEELAPTRLQRAA